MAPEDDNELQNSSGNSVEDAKDDDSEEAVGKEEALELDRDMMDDDKKDSPKQDGPDSLNGGNARKVTKMFQKILSLGGGAGQIVVDTGSEGPQPEATQNDISGPSARKPTMVHQGRMVRSTSLYGPLCPVAIHSHQRMKTVPFCSPVAVI
jgi:hypothetical protein